MRQFLSIPFQLKAFSLTLLGLTATALYADYALTGSSWISGNGGADYGAGTVIRSDGTVVVAANIADAAPGGLTPTLLNGASASSEGAVLILSPNGDTVLSVTRIASEVLDLSMDANDNIYVAAGSSGMVKLSRDASTVLWTAPNGGFCRRIDAAPDGTVVGLNASGSNAGTCYVYNAAGTQIGSFTGLNFTQDIAMSADATSVFQIGYRNANSGANPVQIAYLRSLDISGTVQWLNYDWAATWLDDHDGDGWDNLMADSRGYRVTLGRDGLLYAAFEVAGGNHIFKRVPNRSLDPNRNTDTSIDSINLKTNISIVGGDMWFALWNTQSQHKTFLGRYAPATGDYLRGQELCTRYYNGSSTIGNTLRVENGALAADEDGRVYIAGKSASGLPFNPTHSTSDQSYTAGSGEVEFNPFPITAEDNVYSGGAYLLVLSSDFSKRLYCTRLSGGITRGVDGRVLDGKTAPSVAWTGQVTKLNMDWKNETYSGGTNRKERVLHTVNPFQASRVGGDDNDGFLAVIGQGGNFPPAPVSITHSPIDGDLEFSFMAENGFDYQLKSSPSLATPRQDWSSVGSPISGDGSMKTITEQMSEDPQMFYLIEQN